MISKKIQSLLQSLNQGLVDRENTLKLALLTALAGENIVLVGPPGTGKSLVARRIARSLSDEGVDYFEYLLTKFSTPEELFGPLSIAALKADRFQRNTEGYLPTVRMAFLDEIFKASSSILNALLTILNERVYHNGPQVQNVPLQALIAASNELPTDQEELGALYDRFLVRVFVDYVGAHSLSKLFAPTTEPELHPADRITPAELEQIRRTAPEVAFPPELIQAVQDIWAAHREAFKEDRRESLSDRRLKKVIHLLRVSAATNGRQAVDLSDLMLLKDCLWNHADNAVKVRELVLGTLRRHSRQVPVDQVAVPSPLAEQAPQITYVLDSDGRTLVPISATSAQTTQPTAPARSSAPMGAVVKGYAGSGTADDPLLIQSIDDLMDLTRPEVGQQGYHFRQTADLDISGISTWPAINLKGTYDGGRHSVTDKTVSDDSHRWLFKSLAASRVVGLTLKSCGLSEVTVNKSELQSCSTSMNLTGTARDCNISFCTSTRNIVTMRATQCEFKSCKSGRSIADYVEKSKIHSCQSNWPLILRGASGTDIENCITMISRGFNQSGNWGCIADVIDSTSIKKCLTKADLCTSGISGIVRKINSGKISRCAVGATPIALRGTITTHESTAQTEKNVALDSVKSSGGIDGSPIAAEQFTQRFFEYSLEWDFQNIWIWDDFNQQPTLRHVGADATPVEEINNVQPEAAKGRTVDLLTHQVQANLWL
ncbi:MAG TPA: AAA family ATPase [Burkholderiaceae bacterium]|nr:AAA family ATPase [Burkholderiaceae bacterium]HMY99205.1 AAA family ATPase [Burkholderiaceae bacterium]HNB43926.1 AAA family ATPase [Burkholderiaceae bacterium]HNG78791.1 AAA family ATPase [Burkholderiaceae bacterium]